MDSAVFNAFKQKEVGKGLTKECVAQGKLFPHNKSSPFKILQLADVHLGEKVHIVGDQDNRSLAAIRSLLDIEKPDLVVLSGDVITGEDLYTPEQRHSAFDRLADILENRSIPWAFTFGNHDAANSPMQGPLQVASAQVAGQIVQPISFKLRRGNPEGETKETAAKLGDQVADIFQDPGDVEAKVVEEPKKPSSGPKVIPTKYGWVNPGQPVKAPSNSAPRKDFFEHERSHKLSRTGVEGFFVGEKGTVTNYYLKVYASSQDAEADHPSMLLWFLDVGGGTVPASLSADQISWMQSAHHTQVEKYGPLPGMLFAHMPFKEYEHVDPHSAACTGFSDDKVTLDDPIGGQSQNGRILSLVADLDIDWVFVGHDHGNDWCCPVQVDNGPKYFGRRNGAKSREIQLCYGRHSSYGGYSTPNVQIPGARVVEFDPAMLHGFIQGQSSSSTVKTWVRLEGGMVVAATPDDRFTRALMKDTGPVTPMPPTYKVREPWV